MSDMHRLPDGSGFFTASFPLPKDHWIYAEHENVPPMPLRMGSGGDRAATSNAVANAARYAIRASTANGKIEDFDPDAMVQNFIIGLLGYHTLDGLSGESFGNPDPIPQRRIFRQSRSNSTRIQAMTDPTLEEIARRAEAATAGPWEQDRQSVDAAGSIIVFGNVGLGFREANANADFIAHAREDVPFLLKMVYELRAKIEELERALQRPGTTKGAVETMAGGEP